jgi:GNAT superfamily N-acetyltransferase
MLHAENMTPADFSFAVVLANTMDWNMTQQDFELSLKLEPEGCFVLFDNLTRVGISTCISFGKVGWFGNLVVHQAHRNKGGGKLLLQKAIAYLRKKGVATIGIYAYHNLVKFYESVGFTTNNEFSVLQGTVKTSRIQNTHDRINKKNALAVIGFDKNCFHGNRKKLLEPILLSENNQCYLSKQNGRIDGYVASKMSSTITEVGPLICRKENNDLAKSLFKTALQNSTEQEVIVCLPAENKTLAETGVNCGLKESFRVTRMFLGPAIAESCIYVPESLERG